MWDFLLDLSRQVIERQPRSVAHTGSARWSSIQGRKAVRWQCINIDNIASISMASECVRINYWRTPILRRYANYKYTEWVTCAKHVISKEMFLTVSYVKSANQENFEYINNSLSKIPGSDSRTYFSLCNPYPVLQVELAYRESYSIHLKISSQLGTSVQI